MLVIIDLERMRLLEIAIAIIICIFAFMIVKFLFKKILLCLFILGVTLLISFIFKTSYSTILASIIMILCSIKFIFTEIKHLGSDLIKPCKFYSNGLCEKITLFLFTLNYIIFVCICCIILVLRNFYTINIKDLSIAFCFTWILIWLIGKIKNLLFNHLSTIEYEDSTL